MQDYGFGTHSSTRIDNSAGGGPILYDPAGSFVPKGKKPAEARGSGDTFFDNDADLQDYIDFHKELGSTVETITFPTTPEEELQISRNIDARGGAAPLFCSIATSEVLSGVGPFVDLETSFFPDNLMRDLRNIGRRASGKRAGRGVGAFTEGTGKFEQR